ncbi:MAG: methylated-DNA--[protein]-cysteine S-methyltransferase [Desulfobacterales bacterium]
MKELDQLSVDYERVEKAIEFLAQHVREQPALAEVSRSVGLSEFHFQRLFSRWVGISPKRFLQYLTTEYAKKLIEGSENLLDAAQDIGLSGPGRLHDLFVNCEALTPGEFKRRGEGMEIVYGIHSSPFGRCLLAVTSRGICALRFIRENHENGIVQWLQAKWPLARIVPEPDQTGRLVPLVFPFDSNQEPAPLHLFVRGTNFQIQVWKALLRIPLGKAVTYEDIARHIGLPQAARAVGNAVGANPIPFLIPCHRVIRKTGVFGNYGEGPSRKKAILGWEAVRHSARAS